MPKILVIDDNKDYLVILKDVLNTYKPDYQVFTAQSGKEGIKLAGIEKPDLILLDIKMPEMDGYEVCRQLKQHEELKRIPVVFLTGVKTKSQDRIKGMELGGDAYLTKPVETGELLSQIEIMLRIKKAEDRLLLEKESLAEKVIERTKDLENVITELKKSEKVLHVERDNLKNIFKAMEDGIYIVNQQYDIQYVNPVLIKDFGAYEGRKCYEYFDDRTEVCPWCKNPAVFAGKTVRWEWYSFKNQKTYDLIDTPLKNPDGSISKLVIFRDITERKQAEEALRKTKETAERYLNIAAEIIISLDTSGNITLLNHSGHSLLGYKQGQLIGKNWFTTCLPEEIRNQVRQVFKKLMKGEIENVERYENPVITSKGEERIISWHNSLLRDVDDKIIGTLSSGEDITERKQAEELLYKREQEFRTLVENAPDVISRFDREFRHIYINPAVEKESGMPREYFIGKTNTELGTPEDVVIQWHDAIKSVFETGEEITIYTEIPTPDGKRYYSNRIAPEFAADGSVKSVLNITRNITERKLAEEALRESEALFRTTLYSIGDAVITTGKLGNIQYMNTVAEDLTGWSEQEAAGQPLKKIFRIISEESRRKVENPVERVLREGVVLGLANHTLLISRDGKEIPIADAGAPIKDDKGEITGVVLVFRDQTEERKAHRVLEEARAYAESIIITIREPLLVLDKKLKVISANISFYQNFKTDESETVGKYIYDLGNRQWDIPELRKLLEGILPQNTSFNDFEVKLAFEQIGTRTLLLNARRIYREAEKTQQILLAIEDITERKQAEEALRKSEEKYRLIVENAHDGIEITQDDKFIFTNPRFAEMLGYSVDELKNIPFNRIFTKQATQELYERKQRRQAGKTVPHQYETTMLKKDGTIIDVDVKYEIIDYNEKPATFAIIHDITERKQAEEELSKKLQDLDRANKLMVGRELKMIELKREVNELLVKTGQTKKYSTPEEVNGGIP